MMTGVTHAFDDIDQQGSIRRVHIGFLIRAAKNVNLTGRAEFTVVNLDRTPGNSPVSLFRNVLPLGEGTYEWRVSGFAWSGTDTTDDQSSWNYGLNLQVERVHAVAEPVPMALLGLGIAGLATRRRRPT